MSRWALAAVFSGKTVINAKTVNAYEIEKDHLVFDLEWRCPIKL